MEYCPESNSYYETAAGSRRNKWIYGKFGNLDDSTAVFFFFLNNTDTIDKTRLCETRI